ncbi:unnamed protein product [Psylliodes chrysocephalus]|uniref:Glucose-methanol-choline oxidoreductase N-terminal domain-containing protein n=1 Tax=Psylliodes chrysocephalus TaxID=3402493 RepID=A0A9P0CHG7_9CUCU|nr:unnamed protein product [Psylliodes chrysocephala]
MLIYSFLSPYNWGYLSTPQSTCCQGMSNQQCPFPRGRGLGGSSLINGMFYVRGNSDDYDQWRKLGCRGWSYQDVLPYFKKSEHADFPDADPHYHGFTGPLHVNYTAPPSLIENTFIEAATYNMGLDTVDYNAAKQIGVSPIQYGINFNKRQDTGSLFIKPIENKKNLQISLNSFVIKIIISDNKAVGVEFIKDGIRYQAFARKEVIICAGAVNSAQLLMLSGIGPRNDLEKLGIPVKNDLPVGESFIDHPVFLGLICSTKRRAEASALLEALQAYLRGEAPLTRSFGGESLGFVNVDDPNSTVPNIEFATFPQPRGGDLKRILNLNDQTTEDFLRLDPEVFAHVWVTLLYPKSRGKVYLKSNSPLDFPQIDLNLLSDKYNHDIKTLLKGLKYVIEFFTGKAFGNIDSYISFQLKVCEPYGLFSDKYWICALRQLTTSFFHPVGTTKIGRCQKTSVVDCNLMVHRMKNLRIAGEGIFPRIVGGHTYAPCLMIGEKLADIIKEFNGKL